MIPLGWLAPNGEMRKAEYLGHLVLAEKICDELYPDNSILWPDDKLMDIGYVHITRLSSCGYDVIILHNRFLTEEQKNYIRPYVEELQNWMDEYNYDLLLEDLEK